MKTSRTQPSAGALFRPDGAALSRPQTRPLALPGGSELVLFFFAALIVNL